MEYEITDYGNISFERVAPMVWIVRGHDNGFGSHYDWGFVLVKDGEIGHAKALVSSDPDEINDNMLCSDDIKAIRDFKNNNGMKCVKYVRVRKSGRTFHNIK